MWVVVYCCHLFIEIQFFRVSDINDSKFHQYICIHRWILWFSVCYASAAAARREIFGVNALRGRLHQLGSPNLQDIFIGG